MGSVCFKNITDMLNICYIFIFLAHPLNPARRLYQNPFQTGFPHYRLSHSL